MASKVCCKKCDREIQDRESVVAAIRHFGKAKCKTCNENLDITVSANDVMLLPEPYRTDALCAFTE